MTALFIYLFGSFRRKRGEARRRHGERRNWDDWTREDSEPPQASLAHLLCGLALSCLGPPAPLQSLFAADRRLFVRDARLCRQAGCRPARCGGMRGSLAAVCVGASAGARGCCVASPCPVWVRLLLFSPSLRLIAASSSATLASADKPIAGLHAAGVCEMRGSLAAVGEKGPPLALVAAVWPRPVLFGSACSSSVPLCG